MDGILPDAEDVINRISEIKKYFVTIDMSDIFFIIPVSEKSRQYITFSC